MGVSSLTPAVFFDRDGVLNDAIVRDGTPYPPRSLAELRIASGARRAVAAVRSVGYTTIVITNQPDVARGKQDHSVVDALNAAVAAAVGADAVYTCVHDDADNCACRKPKPGLVLRAAQEHHLDLTRSFFVGDRWKDVACGKSAGCTTIFLDRGYSETNSDPSADYSVSSLEDAIKCILQNKGLLCSVI
jgi:D-glycero-D-manno-heptose 1,7-bisphosphate phosphatase